MQILLTRPAEQVVSWREHFAAAGWKTFCCEMIKISPCTAAEELEKIDAQLKNFAAFNWLLFSSANGVRFFAERFLEVLRDEKICGEQMCQKKIGVVGKETARQVREIWNRDVDGFPTESTAATLAELLHDEAAQQQKFLSVRGSRGSETLKEKLTFYGGEVTELRIYQSEDVTAIDPQIQEMMSRGEFDVTTVSSSSIAQSLAQLFGESLRQTRLVAIGKITAQTLENIGFPAAAIAAESEPTAMVAAANYAVTTKHAKNYD